MLSQPLQKSKPQDVKGLSTFHNTRGFHENAMIFFASSNSRESLPGTHHP